MFNSCTIILSDFLLSWMCEHLGETRFIWFCTVASVWFIEKSRILLVHPVTTAVQQHYLANWLLILLSFYLTRQFSALYRRYSPYPGNFGDFSSRIFNNPYFHSNIISALKDSGTNQLTRMWANAQRHGRQPNIGGALCESSVISFLVPRRKLWLTSAAGVPCSNAANIGERKTWT